MNGWGSSQSFGAPTQNFGAPAQSFGAPVQEWGTGGNPQWTPPSQRSAPLYDANGIAARQDADRYCYGANGWGPAQQQQQQQASKQASSSQSFYKSPNDWLDAPHLTSVMRLSPEGYPLHAFSGNPVDPEWVRIMAMTYPERSWEEMCSISEMPRPKVVTAASQSNRGQAPAQGSSHRPSAVVGQSSRSAAAGRYIPDPLPPRLNPPKFKSTAQVAEDIHSAIKGAQSGVKAVLKTDARREFAQMSKACRAEEKILFDKCKEDLGWTKTQQAVEAAKIAAVSRTAKRGTRGSVAAGLVINKVADDLQEIILTPSCVDAAKKIIRQDCLAQKIKERAEQAAINRRGSSSK